MTALNRLAQGQAVDPMAQFLERFIGALRDGINFVYLAPETGLCLATLPADAVRRVREALHETITQVVSFPILGPNSEPPADKFFHGFYADGKEIVQVLNGTRGKDAPCLVYIPPKCYRRRYMEECLSGPENKLGAPFVHIVN